MITKKCHMVTNFFMAIDEHKGGAVMEAPKSVQSDIELHYSTD